MQFCGKTASEATAAAPRSSQRLHDVRNVKIRRFVRDPWEPPAHRAGAYLRWTVGAARSGISDCELPEIKTAKTRQAKASAVSSSDKQCHTSTQKFYEKLGESASLSPSSCSALSDRKHGKMVRSLESMQQWIEASISKSAKRCWRSWA